MGFLKNRQAEPEAGSRYQMRQRLLSIGDDYWIEHEDGSRAFRVDGKALRIRKTFVLEDASGREVAKLQERKLSVRDKMEIERDGRWSSPRSRRRWSGSAIASRSTSRVAPTSTPRATSSITSTRSSRDGDTIASASKCWFALRDTYGVAIAPGGGRRAAAGDHGLHRRPRPTHGIEAMETNAGFGTTQLFLTDSRLALHMLNHLRHQALNRAFGASREQANVLTFVLLVGAADGAYEAGRRLGACAPARRSATTRPSARLRRARRRWSPLGRAAERYRAFGTLVALAMLGRVAAPTVRRAAQRMRDTEQRLRAAEQRVRRERIRRYVDAQDRARSSAA